MLRTVVAVSSALAVAIVTGGSAVAGGVVVAAANYAVSRRQASSAETDELVARLQRFSQCSGSWRRNSGANLSRSQQCGL